MMGLDEAIHGESYFTLTIEDITKEGSQPLNLRITPGHGDAPDVEKDANYDTQTNSPSNDDMQKGTTAGDSSEAAAAAGETLPAPRSVSRNVSGSRGARVQGDQLSSAVAQLVSQLALPGHAYDIGISRSC